MHSVRREKTNLHRLKLSPARVCEGEKKGKEEKGERNRRGPINGSVQRRTTAAAFGSRLKTIETRKGQDGGKDREGRSGFELAARQLGLSRRSRVAVVLNCGGC